MLPHTAGNALDYSQLSDSLLVGGGGGEFRHTLPVRRLVGWEPPTTNKFQQHAHTGIRYVPILSKTRSLQLLCLDSDNSLVLTDILNPLLTSDIDPANAVLIRAQSYFFANIMIGEVLIFAMRLELLDGEHASEKKKDDGDEDQQETIH